MKTGLFIAGAMALALGMTTTSCDKDDDFYTSDLTLITEMEYDFDDDLLELCDVTVNYTTFDGVEGSEKLIAGDWSQQLQSIVFPCTSYYSVTITPKPGVTPTRAYYDLDFSVEYAAYAYIGKSSYTVLPFSHKVVSNRENVPAAQVQEALTQLINDVNALNYNYTFSIDSSDRLTATPATPQLPE